MNKRDSNAGSSPINALLGLFFLVLLLIGAFFFFRLLFRLLYLIGPVLLIIALILDYKSVLGYANWLRRLVQRNAAMGIAAILLSILGYPIVSAILLGQIMFKKKVRSLQQEIQKREQGEMTDYEELDSRQLPPLKELREDRPGKSKDSDFV